MRANLHAAHRVHDIANLNIRADATNGDDGVHRERVAEVVIAVDGGGACRVGVLPDAEVVVDEGVVHPEDRVRGGCRDVRHDGADAVVAIGVGTVFLSVTRFSLSLRFHQKKNLK